MTKTDLTIRELRQRFADKSLSPLEYWLSLEDHIAAWEPSISALYLYDPESARAQAKASTERWAKGETLGALDGIPVTLKELIATKGQPVPLGTRAVELKPAEADAPAAARLREDGAVIFAKTTCPDYGMLSSGLSSFHPLSRNPWNTTQNPGGSSAGASAAAAAGYGPLHIGTDIGGSVRLPAGWTGIFGFKPSHGRIPADPYYVGRCVGPMARTVEDAAFSMATLSRPDWRDGTSLPPNDFNWMDLDIDVSGMKIGLMLEAGCGLAVEDEIRVAVEAAAQHFEKAGATIVSVQPVLTRAMLDGLDNFWRSRFWGDIADLDEERRDSILPYIQGLGDGRRRHQRRRCGQGLQPDDRDAQELRTAVYRGRRPAFADQSDHLLSGRMGIADQRSGPAVRAYRFHGAVEHVGAAGRFDQLRFLPIGHADRPADRRAAFRRSAGAEAVESLRRLDGRGKILAAASDQLIS